MKLIWVILTIFSLASCSKPSSSPSSAKPNKNNNLDVLTLEQKIDINNNIISADFSDLNLGNIPQNLPLNLIIYLQNQSLQAEDLSISWEGANLNFINNCPASLASRSRCSINLSVNPQNLAVSSNLIGLLSVNESYFSVSGTIVEPVINKELVFNHLNFGNMEARRPKVNRIVVTNKGDNLDIVLDQSQMGSAFSVIYNSCPVNLKKRASCVIDVQALSQTEGSQSALLKISNFDVNLDANFIAYNPVIEIIPSISVVDLGTSTGTNLLKFTVSYFNKSLTDLNPLSIDMPSFFEVEENTCVGSLRSRKYCKVTYVVNSSLMSDPLDYNVKLKQSDVKESLPVRVLYDLTPPTLTASLPVYSKEMTTIATLSTDFADYVKASNSSDCSDGVWEEFSTSLNVNLPTANTTNIKYFKPRKGQYNEGECVSASTIQDSLDPVITFTNSLSQDLNRTGSSTNFDFPFNVADTNRTNNFQYQVYSTINCSGSPIADDSGVLIGGANLITTTFPIRNYRSVKIIHTDLAGRTAEQCSEYVTFGQPFNLTVPGFATTNKIYNKVKSFSGNIKDKFNNNLSGIELTIDSGSDEETVVSDASGNFSFYISGDVDFNKDDNVGVKIKHDNVLTDRVDVLVSDTPGVILSGQMSVIRRSCQELAALDGLTTDGVFTLDPDQDGAALEYSAYCDFDNGEGWSLAAKMATVTSNWENTSTRWTTVGGYVNQNSFLPLSSTESKHSAFDVEIFRTLRISDGASKILKANIASNLTSYSLRDLFANIAINSTTALIRTYYDSGMFTYFGYTGNLDLGPGVVAGFESGSIPMYVNLSTTACAADASGGVRIGVWAGHSNGCDLNSLSSVFVGIGGRVAKKNLASLVGGTSAVTNFSSLWVKGVEYRNPTSCTDALARNPSLSNAGEFYITIDPDGNNFGAAPISQGCDFRNNVVYKRLPSWDNTASIIQRSASAYAQAAYANNLFVKASFPGLPGGNPSMGNPAGLDLVGLYSLSNPTHNQLAGKQRVFVMSQVSNGLCNGSTCYLMFFTKTGGQDFGLWTEVGATPVCTADLNMNGLLDVGENGDCGQIALYANGRAVWIQTRSDATGSQSASAYFYARDLTNETYWIKE